MGVRSRSSSPHHVSAPRRTERRGSLRSSPLLTHPTPPPLASRLATVVCRSLRSLPTPSTRLRLVNEDDERNPSERRRRRVGDVTRLATLVTRPVRRCSPLSSPLPNPPHLVPIPLGSFPHSVRAKGGMKDRPEPRGERRGMGMSDVVRFPAFTFHSPSRWNG